MEGETVRGGSKKNEGGRERESERADGWRDGGGDRGGGGGGGGGVRMMREGERGRPLCTELTMTVVQ